VNIEGKPICGNDIMPHSFVKKDLVRLGNDTELFDADAMDRSGPGEECGDQEDLTQ
jgi:hypothetical protein